MMPIEPPPAVSELNAKDLEPFLAEQFAGASARLAGRSRMSGGASKDIWLFEVETGEGTGEARRFVLRRSVRESATSLSIEAEYTIMRAAFEAGVAGPEPFYLGRDSDGRPFFIMEFIEGETLAPRLFRKEEFAEARGKIAGQLGALLAPIHAMKRDPAIEKFIGTPPEGNPARAALDNYVATYRRVARNPHPVFEIAIRYLGQRLPEDWEICLNHGDYRLGNVIFDSGGVCAILDWELVHYSDPMSDLSWPAVRAWRFGHDEHPVAGVGSREDLFAAYEAAGGRKVDPDRFRWWEIFGNLRWGIITLSQASPFLEAESRDLEKAVIGRRASEVEAQLLNLIRE